MRLTRSVWGKLLEVDREFHRRGEQLSRSKLKNVCQVCERDARFLYDALQYRDIISMRPDAFGADAGTKELILSDIHIPFQDSLALSAALDFADKYQPDIIVLLGDTIDFYRISRFVKNPTQKPVSAEIAQVKAFLSDLRFRFPKARIIYYRGNHEERLDAYVMGQSGELYDLLSDLLEIKLGMRDMGVEYLTEPFKIGRLNHLHGHERGGGSYNPEYVTNVVFNLVLDNFVCGHFHRTQDKVFKRIDKSIFMGLAVGYLGGEMEYARLNKWNQGFATVEYGDDGKFRAHGYKLLNGEIF